MLNRTNDCLPPCLQYEYTPLWVCRRLCYSDSFYGATTVIPESVIGLLMNDMDTGRGQFFLHAASLDIPTLGISVSAPKPTFWNPIMDLLKQDDES